MFALNHNQRFVLILLLGLVSGTWLIADTAAFTLRTEDRPSLLKAMDILFKILDETESLTTSTEKLASSTASPNASSTTPRSQLTSTTSNASTVSESSSQSTTTTTTTSTIASTTTEHNNNVISLNSSELASPVRKRLCFKRVCLKFANDRGYIY